MSSSIVGGCNAVNKTLVTPTDFTFCDGSSLWTMKGPLIGTCTTHGRTTWDGTSPTVCISGSLYRTPSSTALIQSAFQAAYGISATPQQVANWARLMSQNPMTYSTLLSSIRSPQQFRLEDFGATHDGGRTDSTVFARNAINAAIDFWNQWGRPTEVLFDQGHYRMECNDATGAQSIPSGILISLQNPGYFRNGDGIQITSPDLNQVKETGTIQLQPNGQLLLVDTPSIPVQPGDVLFNFTSASSKVTIINNHIGPLRGAFELRTPNSVFANNRIDDPGNAHIYATYSAQYLEGPVHSSPPVTYSNSVANGTGALLMQATQAPHFTQVP